VQANVSQTTEHVANETELQNALNNTNINNIVLDGNITNNSNSTFSLNNGTARQLTISGKQSDGTNASWNTGSGYVYLGSGTESNNKQWDISFEDIDITSTNSNGWSPVSLNNGVTGNISFNNVTNGGNGVLVYAPSANVTVQNTSSKPASSATDPNITANNVNIGDNVNLVTTQNNYNDGNVYANGNITVTGKNISLNSQADSSGSTSDAATNLYAGGNIDFKTGSDATLTAASSQSNNVNNLNINGTLTVEKDANVVVNSNVTANNVSTPTGFNSYSFPSGCSSITLVNNGAVIDGNLTINATAVPNSSGVVAGIGVQGNPSNAADVIIGSTGKYVVNATNSRDTRGIFYCADNHTVGLAEGAQAQFNMGHGVSNAIFRADNVILKPNASINITTYQDNNGNSNNGIQSDGAGDHSGPIVVGWSPTGSADNSSFVNNNTHATIEIDKDANLTIIRKTDSNSKQANSPLIDFGSNGSNGFSMNLTMNGGRMDLEDALQMDSHSGTPFDGSASYLGSEKEIFPMGMIVMFGTSSSDYVKITDPELFKMVRTGAQKGMLFRLEGTTNSINVASSDGEAIPLDYATVGGVKYSNGKVSTNTAYKWNITNLNTVNKMGNWAANYNNKGGSTSDAPDSWSEGVPFGEAQASVTFAPVALSDEPSDLSTPADFNNYFNWWSASNVAMGSDLIPDADKNDPKGGTITVNENAVLIPADAEQAITNKADLTNVSTYSWDKDATPSTAKPGTFDGKVIVTYADKSEDIVPVKVIVKSLADEYTPEGQTVNVKKGQTPDAEEGIKNTNELPKGTKYTWKTTPDTSTVGTKSATVVVTYPDGSKDEVPVKVVVTDNSQPSQQPDAEKYEPEGQTVNVKKGQTPNAEEGIKNTNDMPSGTKYTWKTTPDTSTVGTKSATIVVTYPDGSKDEVPVKVVVTKDQTQPVTPTTPEQPNTPETPTNTTKVIEPTNPDDPNQKDLFKHVTRTIIIKEPGKKAKKIIQTATFTRNKTINTVTGDVISYGKWTPSTRTLDKVPTPNVNGYSKHIDGDLNTIKVSPTSADTVVKVTYTRKPKATEQNTNDTNHSTHTTRVDTSNHESNKNSNSNNGFDYNNSPKSITIPLNNRSTDQIINWLKSKGYQVTVNSNGEITSIVKVNKNKVYNYTISPEGKLILTSITSLENSSKANNTMINSLSTSQNGKESQSTSMKELPQTGSKDDDLASIGLAMATISGLLGLIVDRKRKQQ
ncbi:Rib/alpha-like domain-containing protein, partial [Lactobacillus intestinalis]|uniref:Rib/alpha-like domain-containing protein n=1 Tax=Lactobacillus intestinalis TaxID=151781 RepID=UPI0026ECC921